MYKVCEIIVTPVNDGGITEHLVSLFEEEIINGPYMIDCEYRGVTHKPHTAEALNYAETVANDPNVKYMFIFLLSPEYDYDTAWKLGQWQASRYTHGAFVFTSELGTEPASHYWMEQELADRWKPRLKMITAEALLDDPQNCEDVITHLASV